MRSVSAYAVVSLQLLAHPFLMAAVTIYDIAEKAKVSIATVSRAFNNSPRVSARTRDRILGIAQELGYQPHASARSLAKRQSNLVSAIIPMLTSYFFLEVLHGVQERISESEFDLLVYSAPRMEEIDGMLENALNRGRSAGVLLFSSPLTTERLKRLNQYANPVVLVDLYHEKFDSVATDNEYGGYLAASHLLDKGFRRIGALAANSESEPSQQRMNGFRRAHQEKGIALDEHLIEVTSDSEFHGFTEEAGYAGMVSLLEKGIEIDAVFAVSDIQALGARRAIEDHGKSVPEDIALIGFDDIMISKYVELTTLRQPMNEMGRLAADLLLGRIQEPRSPIVHKILAPALVERTSSSVARSSGKLKNQSVNI